MAANSSAHSAKAGYNQSGGAYFMCVTPLSGSLGTGTDAVTDAAPLGTASSHLYKISVAASKSGGAFEAATLTRVSAQEVFGVAVGRADEVATEFGAGKLIKDMGKTIISGTRTFRKFAVAPTTVSNYGVVGAPAVAPGAGYGSFYLDVGREGSTGGTVPAPIARYF